MGDLIRAALVLAASTLAGTTIVNGASGFDANDRVWFFDAQSPGGAVQSGADVAGGFKTAVVSYNVRTPGGSSVDVRLRARVGARWTRWYDMGSWSADLRGGRRHSVAGQRDADGDVDTDTLELNAPASAFEVGVQPRAGAGGDAPVLQMLAVATSLAPELHADADAPGSAIAELAVPERSQRIASSPDAKGGGGDSWCSPASVSMVMAYWAQTTGHPQWDIDVASIADGVYDPVYDGCGNWPFNVAFASEHGLAGFVCQFPSLAAIELLVARGVPVIASIAVKPGELDGAPYKKTAGHLLVVRGFTAAGDVIVNDPYGEPGTVRRVYARPQFAHVWQAGSNGTVYIIAPPDMIKSLR
ncbi:MAG: peptidase C39 family protein [Candidatus Eremiobacteraeota bacterium]|nr:peptidase C39 family protein [Candidatus Eremiobacteraeota bacterium]